MRFLPKVCPLLLPIILLALSLSPLLVEGGEDVYKSTDVVSLTSSNFNKLVKQGDELWIVEFYAPWCGHCQALVPEYKKAARALKGVVKVGAVNADEDQSLASEFQIQGFPTIKIYNGKKFEDYNGERTSKGLVEAALRAVRNKVEDQLGGKTSGGGGSSSGSGSKDDVIELTDSNFDKLVLNSNEPWLVEFYAPWCGHCKNLAPEWAKAATALKGKVKLGAVDATVHQSKAQQYGVRGYPTIKFFPSGPKKDAQEYDGGRTASDIIEWASGKAEANLPPPELLQIVDEDAVLKGCGEHSICVVSVLPHILDCDAKCRNGYLDMLRAQGEKYKKQQWGWLWTQGGDHLNVEEALDIGGFGYPAMAAVNLKKGKYSLFRGSFSADGVSEFLRDLSYGRGSVLPLRGTTLPKISTVEPWDGKDGQLPEEESFDFDDKDEL